MTPVIWASLWIGRLWNLRVQERCHDGRLLHQDFLVCQQLILHAGGREAWVDCVQRRLAIVTMLDEQRERHRDEVKRRLAIGREALHYLARRPQERGHDADILHQKERRSRFRP
jgi:hypothetical protein